MQRLLGSAALLAIAVAVVLPAAILLPAVSASANTSDFSFDSFAGDYTVSRLADGTSHLDVVETLVARFPDFDQNHGIIRAIPNDYNGVDLGTVVKSVTDQNGQAVRFQERRQGGFVDLTIGGDAFVHGAASYVISYSQTNVVRSFADTKSDELYWNINGTGWSQPFGLVSAMVHVDPALVPSLSGNAACYVGVQGATTACPIATPTPATGAQHADYAASAQHLTAGQTLTVSIGFAPGTFVTPQQAPVPVPVPVGVDLLSGAVGLLSLALLALAIAARVRSGRGAPKAGFIIPQYSEPDGITIVQSANLMARPATAIPAAIVRLAVRKNLRILDYETAAGAKPYSLQYLGKTGTNVEDQALLDIIFGAQPAGGETVAFGPSNQTVMRGLEALSTAAAASLQPAGFLSRPQGRGTGALLVSAQLIVGFFAVVIFAVSASRYYSISAFLLPAMVVGALAFIGTIIAAARPLRPTERGAQAREFLLGMQMYLTLAEKDRLRALQSPSGADRVDVGDNRQMIKLYEKLLPWAVLWGVEDQWMKELAVRVESLPEQPDWFIGANGFNALLFAGAIQGFSTAMVAPVAESSWGGNGNGGSFSGGSFGGGFSGGGGGGGGGGGF